MSSFHFVSLCFLLILWSSQSQPVERILSDPMNSGTASSWTSGDNVNVPASTGCPYTDPECFQLIHDGDSGLNDGWIMNTFDVSGYHNITIGFSALTTNNSGFFWIYSYDNGNVIGNMGYSFQYMCCYSLKYPSIDPRPPSLWNDLSSLGIRIELKNTDVDVKLSLSDFFIDGIPYTSNPTKNPTDLPTISPTGNPSITPSVSPSAQPTETTNNPTGNPSVTPSISPSANPSVTPTAAPSSPPTIRTNNPTRNPSGSPSMGTQSPSILSLSPSVSPSVFPSVIPTKSSVIATQYVNNGVMMKILVSITLILTMQIFAL